MLNSLLTLVLYRKTQHNKTKPKAKQTHKKAKDLSLYAARSFFYFLRSSETEEGFYHGNRRIQNSAAGICSEIRNATDLQQCAALSSPPCCVSGQLNTRSSGRDWLDIYEIYFFFFLGIHFKDVISQQS